MARDSVREHLRRRGAAQHVVDRGLGGLVERWERFARDVEAGYRLGLDEWRNDVDVREILDDALGVASEDERRAWRRRVRKADAHVRGALVPTPRCVWGAANAAKNGWNPGRHWWYFLVPAQANSELQRELEARG